MSKEGPSPLKATFGETVRWLSQPSVRRGLVWVALLSLALFWGLAVIGISLSIAETGEQWWVLPLFGVLAPCVVLGGAYLFRPERGSKQSSAPPSPPTLSDSTLVLARTSELRTRVVDEPPVELLEPFTAREAEVLELLASGRSNREIAAELVVALGTVKAHLNHIFRKLEARNRTEAVARARELQLLQERVS